MCSIGGTDHDRDLASILQMHVHVLMHIHMLADMYMCMH